MPSVFVKLAPVCVQYSIVDYETLSCCTRCTKEVWGSFFYFICHLLLAHTSLCINPPFQLIPNTTWWVKLFCWTLSNASVWFLRITTRKLLYELTLNNYVIFCLNIFDHQKTRFSTLYISTVLISIPCFAVSFDKVRSFKEYNCIFFFNRIGGKRILGKCLCSFWMTLYISLGDIWP